MIENPQLCIQLKYKSLIYPNSMAKDLMIQVDNLMIFINFVHTNMHEIIKLDKEYYVLIGMPLSK